MWRRNYFQVSLKGGTPRLFLPVQGTSASLSQDGRSLVYTRGSLRWWRKRNKNPYHRHLWRYDLKRKTFSRITKEKATADFPGWVGKEKIVFRSEKSGILNLWMLDLKTQKRRALTHFKKWGIRHPGVSANGKVVVFGAGDRLYRLSLPNGKVEEVSIQASGDLPENQWQREVLRGGISEYALSPNKKEVAFVAKGEVYVKDLKDPGKWARRITRTDWRERDLCWSPDGRTLSFSSNRGGQYAIYFARAGERKGKPISLSQTYRPVVSRWTPKEAKVQERRAVWSPNGKELAFVRGRGLLVVRSAKGTKERVIVKGWNIGTFRWSPDGRWFLFARTNHESSRNIFLVGADGKSAPTDISRFPDDDFFPVWSANGKMMAFLSRGVYDRYLIRFAFLRERDHEKSPMELKRTFLRWKKAWKKRQRRKAKVALKKKKAGRKARKSEKVGALPVKKSAGVSGKKKKVGVGRALKVRKHRMTRRQIAGLPFRLRTISGLPGSDGAGSLLMSPDGSQFLFVVSDRKLGGLYRISWNGKGLTRLYRGRVRQVMWGAKGSLFLLAKGGALIHLKVKGKKGLGRPVRWMAEWDGDRAKARLQLFEEAWGILNDGFYDGKFHGADWPAVRKFYRGLIRHAVVREDFDDIIFMMLGELNASHLGIYHRTKGPRSNTGNIGIRWDGRFEGPGLKVVRVRSKGPASRRVSRLRRGDVIVAVDGVVLTAVQNLYKLLNWRVGREVQLDILRKGKKVQLYIRPVGARKAYQERYEAWVRRTRKIVEKRSKGLLTYLHIQSMGMKSLDQFERELFAHAHGKKGLVLDVRNNGGGWTADRLLAMFLPRAHATTRWRGAAKEGYPVARRPYYIWHRPTILLCNERSGSNAEIFTHAFKHYKLGTVVGMPTAGAVISTGGRRLLDGSLFRLPLRGWWTLRPNRFNMENGPAVPHVLIPISPEDERGRRDPQLLKAIELLTKQISSKK